MIYAYSKLYLDSTQDILGHAFDWIVNTCGEDLNVFFERLARSSISKLFGLIQDCISAQKVLDLYGGWWEDDPKDVADVLKNWMKNEA